MAKNTRLTAFVFLLVLCSLNRALGEPEIIEPVVRKVVELPGLTEGPIFDENGNFYMVARDAPSGNLSGTVYRVDVNTGQKSVLCQPRIDSYYGVPNGGQVDQEGVLWIADLRLGLLRVTSNGTYQQMFQRDSVNDTMQGLNDVSFDYNGTMWLTAPAGPIAPFPYKDGVSNLVNGSIYSYVPGQKKVTKLDTGFEFSNGILVKHDNEGNPETLIVSEVFSKKLWAYDITGPGEVNNRRLWATAPGEKPKEGPDGIDLDSEGNLLLANFGESHIEVFGPNGGQPIARIKMPFSRVTNLEFKPNSNEVYVTEGDTNSLWMFKWRNKGMVHYSQLNMGGTTDDTPKQTTKGSGINSASSFVLAKQMLCCLVVSLLSTMAVDVRRGVLRISV